MIFSFSHPCFKSVTKLFSRYWVALCMVFILVGCKSGTFKEKFDEGSIVFDIEYVNNSGKSFPLQLLPKTIEMKFNQNFTSYTIEDRVGLFSISNIVNLHNHKNETLIKVFDKKYVYSGGGEEPPVFFNTTKPYEISYQNDTVRVAGILCKRASYMEQKTQKPCYIFYTTNIKVRAPYANTPYSEVKGLLMQFSIQMKNLDMKLTAKKVTAKEISDEEFAVPEEYKAITKKHMEEIINTLLP